MISLDARNRAEEEVDAEGSWAISYGDMVTLLLMFFILFFSIDKDRDRLRNLEKALLRDLSSSSAGDPGKAAPLNVGTLREEGIDEKLINSWGGRVIKQGSKIVIEFPDVSFFDFGQVKLSGQSKESLERFANAYMPYAGNYLLTVRAFTDTVPVLANGSSIFRDNLELSSLRAVAAVRALQKYGIPLKRMRAEGFGELRLSAEERQRGEAETNKRGGKGIDMARRIILVIEPEMRDRL